jgi:hypothetical protein
MQLEGFFTLQIVLKYGLLLLTVIKTFKIKILSMFQQNFFRTIKNFFGHFGFTKHLKSGILNIFVKNFF